MPSFGPQSTTLDYLKEIMSGQQHVYKLGDQLQSDTGYSNSFGQALKQEFLSQVPYLPPSNHQLFNELQLQQPEGSESDDEAAA